MGQVAIKERSWVGGLLDRASRTLTLVPTTTVTHFPQPAVPDLNALRRQIMVLERQYVDAQTEHAKIIAWAKQEIEELDRQEAEIQAKADADKAKLDAEEEKIKADAGEYTAELSARMANIADAIMKLQEEALPFVQDMGFTRPREENSE